MPGHVVDHLADGVHEVTTKAAGVDGDYLVAPAPSADGLDDEFVLVGPAPVDRRLARPRPGRYGDHAHPLVTDLGQQLEGGIKNGLLAGIIPGSTRGSATRRQ